MKPQVQSAPPISIPSLDGIRAVAVLTVMAAHFIEQAGLNNLIPGSFGVTIFFFLSGYLITTLMRVEQEHTGTVAYGAFYLRRALRILPPFYLVLFTATFATMAGLLPNTIWPTAVLAQALHLTNYHIVLHGWWEGIAPGTFIFWSLAIEEHFYLVFPWLFVALSRLRNRRTQALILLTLCALVLLWRCVLVFGHGATKTRVYAATDTRFDSILFGCVLALWGNPALDKPSLSEKTLKWRLLPLACLGLIFTFVVRDPWFLETIRYTLQGLCLFPLYIVAVRYPTWGAMRVLSWPVMTWLGRVSYALYLVHPIILVAIDEHARLSAPGLWVTALAACLSVAWLIGTAVERPALRLRRRLLGETAGAAQTTRARPSVASGLPVEAKLTPVTADESFSIVAASTLQIPSAMPATPSQTRFSSIAATQAHDGDASLAVQNAAKLGGSLLLTWGIAAAVRLSMPRFLGPDAWGPLTFSDAFATTFFVALSLGIDTYIRREVSVRPEHASDFVASITLVRVLGAVILLCAMHLVMVLTNRPPEVRTLAHVFGVSSFVLSMNMSLAALLHARGTVNGLSLLNIVSKLFWAGGTMLTLAMGWPLVGIPAALLVSETLKLVVSFALVQRHLQVRWKWNGLALQMALLASLPLFLNTVAHTIYSKLDVTILAVVAGDREVAWYGAASLLASMTLIVAPVIGWVLMPLFARARARSEEEFTRILRRSLEAVLIFAVPTSLIMALGANLWVRLLYGQDYGPAATSLRILSPLFILTYVAMLNANVLILTERAWPQAVISVLGLCLNPILNWFFIPRAAAWLGPGGAGNGAAWAQLLTEASVTAMLVWLVGQRAFDQRTLLMLMKTAAICVAVWALDRTIGTRLSPLLRLACDLTAYVMLLLFTRAVRIQETLDFTRAALLRRPAIASAERSPS